MGILNVDDLFIPDFTETATIGSKSYDCIREELTAEEQYSMFGATEGIDLILTMKIRDFTTMPTKGTLLEFDGTTYRIGEVKKDADNSTFDVALKGAYD